jgi:ADP-heptose:LPS heptosyltransferase
MNVFFHYGALGDFVLTLPMLRRLAGPTTLVTAWTRATLASRLIQGITPMDIQMWEFMRLHAEGGPTSVSPAVGELFSNAKHVISFISTGDDDWARNVHRLSPSARHIYVDPRQSENWDQHVGGWHTQQADQQGLELGPDVQPELSTTAGGPVVIHPGSGGIDKCWPVERFEALIDGLRSSGREVTVLLGEAEAERWPKDALDRWRDNYCAKVFTTLDDLHTEMTGALAYVGNDSGPTHLAAQLGLPTVALFGPTDPIRWAPVGPAVTILAPPSPAAMDWLEPDAVLEACAQKG